MSECGGTTERANVPRWMWPAAVFLVCFSVYLLVVRTELPLWLEASAMWLRFAIEAGSYFWASRRVELPRGLRASLCILGGATLWSCLVLGVMVGSAAGLLTGVEKVITVGGSISYLLYFVGIVTYPRVPLGRSRVVTAALDALIVAGALGMMQWQIAAAGAEQPNHDRVWVLIYATAQVAMMTGLSVVINVGSVTPSKRAFWWFIVALGTYLPVTFFGQIYALTLNEPIRHVSLFFYFAGLLAAMLAAIRLRGDPLESASLSASPPWLFDINPMTLLMPLAVGTMLVVFIGQGKSAQAIPLAVTLGVISFVLIVRVVLTARETARLQRMEREAEARLLQMRREERSRMLADMHDGFGSHLLSARLMAETGDLGSAQLAELLSECLADLHLIVDTLNTRDDSLASALGDYRHRLQRRLEGHPCELDWDVRLEGMPPVSTGAILQLLRILQEALTNALKHADARQICLAFAYDPNGTLSVRIADDGRGISAERRGGHGLESMRRRARKLGAALTIEPSVEGTGTIVALELPLSPNSRLSEAV